MIRRSFVGLLALASLWTMVFAAALFAGAAAGALLLPSAARRLARATKERAS